MKSAKQFDNGVDKVINALRRVNVPNRFLLDTNGVAGNEYDIAVAHIQSKMDAGILSPWSCNVLCNALIEGGFMEDDADRQNNNLIQAAFAKCKEAGKPAVTSTEAVPEVVAEPETVVLDQTVQADA